MSTTEIQAHEVLLVVFGDLHLSANVIFERLLQRRIWLVSRLPKRAALGMKMLFYQSGVGFRAIARLRHISSVEATDLRVLEEFEATWLRTKLVLDDVEVFKKPVAMGPLVHSLCFVKNKQFWGQALRAPARIIPLNDLLLILQHAIG